MLQSLPHVFQTINLLFQIVAQQVFESISRILPIYFPNLFSREQVCCREWYSQRTKVFRAEPQKHFYHKACGLDRLTVSFLEIFLAFYRTKIIVKQFQRTLRVSSNSSKVKFGLLFEAFNQNLDYFPLQVCILSPCQETQLRASSRTAACIDRFVILCALKVVSIFSKL